MTIGKSFDVVKAIRDLDGRVRDLERNVVPFATMDASGEGVTLYLGEEFNENLYLALAEAGYLTNDDLRAASDGELRKIQGIGPSTLRKIRGVLGQPV